MGFSGTGWEKRGSRHGISGSGAEAGGGRVFGQSSSSQQRRSSTAKPAATSSSFKKPAAKMAFAVGDVVDHKTFGQGKVTKIDGDMLFVYFDKLRETKKLLKDYAPIVKLG